MNKIWLWLDHKQVALAALLVLLLSLTAVMVVAAQSGEGFDLSWNVVGGGGGYSQTSGYELSSTVGQTAVGESQGSGVEMHHGFWQTFIDTLFTRLPLTVKH